MPPSACTNVGACGGSQSQPSKVYFMPLTHEEKLEIINKVQDELVKKAYQVDSPLYYPPLTADDATDPLFTPSQPELPSLPSVFPPVPMQPILPGVNRRLFNVGKSLLPQATLEQWSWRKIGLKIAIGAGIALALALGLAIMFALGDFLARVIGY